MLVEAIFRTEQKNLNIFMHKHYHTLIDILVFVNKVFKNETRKKVLFFIFMNHNKLIYTYSKIK